MAERNFMNVREKWYMYDTVMISPWVATLSHPIPGWYPTFVALSTSDEITFFNSRNKSIGIAYNNQEARDQLPYALVAETISVGFFGAACSSLYGTPCTSSPVRGRIDFLTRWWEDEVPQHTSAILRINQDERLKIVSSMVPASYGPTGHSMGQGDTSTLQGCSSSVTADGMGVPQLKYRWNLDQIGVPRRATLSVGLRFTEWVRAWLARVWGPGSNQFSVSQSAEVYLPSAFLMQVLIEGRREVQQRGEYHA